MSKIFVFILISLFFTSCSLNKNSKFFEVPTPIDVYEFAMKDVILINKGLVYAPKQSGLGVNIDWDILLTADYCKQITRGFS